MKTFYIYDAQNRAGDKKEEERMWRRVFPKQKTLTEPSSI